MLGFLFPHPPLAPACCRASPTRCCLLLFSRPKIALDMAGGMLGVTLPLSETPPWLLGKVQGLSSGDEPRGRGCSCWGCHQAWIQSILRVLSSLPGPTPHPPFATSLPVSGVGGSTWTVWLHPMEQSRVGWGPTNPQGFPMPTSPPQAESCTHGLPQGFLFMSCSFPINVSDSLSGGWDFPLSAGVPLFPPQTPSGAMGTISAGATQTLLL